MNLPIWEAEIPPRLFSCFTVTLRSTTPYKRRGFKWHCCTPAEASRNESGFIFRLTRPCFPAVTRGNSCRGQTPPQPSSPPSTDPDHSPGLPSASGIDIHGGNPAYFALNEWNCFSSQAEARGMQLPSSTCLDASAFYSPSGELCAASAFSRSSQLFPILKAKSAGISYRQQQPGTLPLKIRAAGNI